MSNEIATMNTPVDTAIAGTAATIFSPEGLNQLMKFAEVMAQSRVTVPAHLAGKPADCMAVVMQAAQWGMNPFAVAQKTHLVNGQLGYEAQLVSAVVNSSNLLKERLNFKWDGDWSKVNGKTDKSPDLKVTVWGTLRGEKEPRYLTISMKDAGVRNSPLWEQDPKQQLAYLCVKRWSRLHTSDVLLGVYTPDELQETTPRIERDITPPAATAQGMNSLINSKQEQKQEERQQHKDDRGPEEILHAFSGAAMNYNTQADLDKAYKYVAQKLAGDDDLLAKATDVYTIRCDELNEVPM
ncbi:recombinase RecT [Salmonella enterica]|nr:recombinase RecT [Salmonella enterica]